jgi:type 1 fimbria pilin
MTFRLLALFAWLCSPCALAAGDTTHIEVAGQLISPPCSARFAGIQHVDLGLVSLNQLHDAQASSVDVPLVFDCRDASRVDLKLSAADTSDRHTLATSLAQLGLRLNLLRLQGPVTDIDFSLGQTKAFTVSGQTLELTLRVTPVMLETLPEAGSYNALLMLEMSYL